MTSRDISPEEHFNRDTPSPKYTSLLKEYKIMHNYSDRMFNGRSLLKFVDIIQAYLEKNECQSILDYGCGKGALYTEDFHTITKEINKPLPEYWNIDLCAMYDPAYAQMFWNIYQRLIWDGYFERYIQRQIRWCSLTLLAFQP